MKQVQKAYESYLRKIADQPGLWEVNGETRENLQIIFQNGRQIAGGSSHQTVLYARAGSSSTGYAVSQRLTEEPETLLRQATANGTALENPLLAQGNSDMISTEEQQVLSGTGRLQTILQNAGQELPCDGAALTAKEVVHHQWVVNQKNFSRFYSRRQYEVKAEAMGRSFQISAAKPQRLPLNDLAADMRDWQQCCCLPEGHLASGTYRAVLSNYVMCKFWITGWQLFNGRQYAAGTGAFQHRLLQRIASEKVNLQDVPALPEGGYQAPFDCEGSEGVPAKLVEQGILCGLMHNLESAQAMQAVSTGNAGRTAGLVVGTDIVVTPRNFVMQPGDASTEELLEQVGDGLYIYDAFDEFHAVNAASGQFSFPCSAVWVRGGRKTEKITGLTMNGFMGDLLENVLAVGNRLCYMPLLMHDTWQTAAPAALVSEIRITAPA